MYQGAKSLLIQILVICLVVAKPLPNKQIKEQISLQVFISIFNFYVLGILGYNGLDATRFTLQVCDSCHWVIFSVIGRWALFFVCIESTSLINQYNCCVCTVNIKEQVEVVMFYHVHYKYSSHSNCFLSNTLFPVLERYAFECNIVFIAGSCSKLLLVFFALKMIRFIYIYICIYIYIYSRFYDQSIPPNILITSVYHTFTTLPICMLYGKYFTDKTNINKTITDADQ